MRSIGPQSDSSGQELLYYNDFWSNYREYNKIEKGLFLGSPDQDLLSSFDECFKFITNTQNKGLFPFNR